MTSFDESPHARPLRVLMVDDSPLDLEFIRILMSQVPGHPLLLGTPWRRWPRRPGPRIESGAYDLLLILDLNLPDAAGMDGLAAVREIAPDLPVVVVSGDDGSVRRARRDRVWRERLHLQDRDLCRGVQRHLDQGPEDVEAGVA